MADGDLLEILDAPEVAVLADRPKIEAGDAERLGADLRIPAIEAAEVEIGRAVRQPPRLDRIEVVNQKQEDVTVGSVERGRVAGDVDLGIVHARRPVEHAGHLPSRIAGAVARNPLHGSYQLMIEDAAIVGPGDRAQLDASVLHLEGFDQFATMRGEPVLKVDGSERRRKLSQIGGRRADHGGELAEAPVGRRERHVAARHDQRQSLRIVAPRFHADCRALRGPRSASLGSAGHGTEQLRQGQIAFVGRAREPFRGHATDSFAAAHIDLESSMLVASGVLNIQADFMGYLHDGAREPLSQPLLRHEELRLPLTLSRASQ